MKEYKDRWDAEAEHILEMKKKVTSLSVSAEFQRYLASKLRNAYRAGQDEVRDAIRHALKIDD